MIKGTPSILKPYEDHHGEMHYSYLTLIKGDIIGEAQPQAKNKNNNKIKKERQNEEEERKKSKEEGKKGRNKLCRSS